MMRGCFQPVCAVLLTFILICIIQSEKAQAQESLPAAVARHEQEIKDLRQRLQALEAAVAGKPPSGIAATEQPTEQVTPESSECFQRTMKAAGQYTVELGTVWNVFDFMPSFKVATIISEVATLFSENQDLHKQEIRGGESITVSSDGCNYILTFGKPYTDFAKHKYINFTVDF
jgi:hypothetical protein